MKNFILIILVLLVSACAERILPTEPSLGDVGAVPEKKVSSIILPFSVDMTALENFVNAQLPQNLNSGGIPGVHNGSYNVRRNGGIRFTTSGSKLIFDVPLKVTAHGCHRFCAGVRHHGKCYGGWVTNCGDADASVTARIVSDIAINPDYSITSNSEIFAHVNDAHLHFDILGVIRFNIDIKSKIEGPIRDAVRDFNSRLDSKINAELAQYNLREECEKYWNDLGKPVTLVEDKLYLEVEPKEILFQNLHTVDNKLSVKLGIASKLNVVTGDPQKHESPLPNLNTAGDLTGNFNIYLPVAGEFDAIKREAGANIIGKTYANNKYNVTIKDIDIYGAGNAIVAGVDFKGKIKGMGKKIKGKLYFIAVPEYDAVNKVVYIKDFKLSPETNNLLLNKGLPWMVNNFYYDELKNKMRYDIGTQLTNLRADLNEKLANLEVDLLKIHGSVDDISFEGFHIENKVMHLIVSANGILDTDPIELQ